MLRARQLRPLAWDRGCAGLQVLLQVLEFGADRTCWKPIAGTAMKGWSTPGALRRGQAA